MSKRMKGYQPTEPLANPNPPSGGSGLKDTEEADEIVVFALKVQFENNSAMDKWVLENSGRIFQTECDREKGKIEAELSKDSQFLFRLNEPKYQVENKIVRWKTWRKRVPI